MFSIILNGSGESGYPWPVPELRGNYFNVFWFMRLAVVAIDRLYNFHIDCFYSWLMEKFFFMKNRCQIIFLHLLQCSDFCFSSVHTLEVIWLKRVEILAALWTCMARSLSRLKMPSTTLFFRKVSVTSSFSSRFNNCIKWISSLHDILAVS